MTLRDEIKQQQRPAIICLLVGLVLFLVPVAFAALKGLGLADPWGGGYFGLLMMLLVVGGALCIIGVIAVHFIRCPKCRRVLGGGVSYDEKHCRYCGADFDAEV